MSNNYWTLYKFRYDVVQMFVKKGYEVILIAGKDSFHLNFNNKKIKKIFLPIDERGLNPLSEIKTMVSLYRIYKNIKTDLIIHFTIKPNIYGSIICKLLNINSISFITGVGHIFLKKKSFFKDFISRLYKYALSKNKEVWFTNKSDKELFIKNKIINKNMKIKIVPGAGVIFKEHPEIIKRDQGTDFLMVSRVLKDKGVKEFLKVAEMYNKNKNVTFMLIGVLNDNDRGAIKREYLENYIENKTITYLEYQEDIMKYLKETSCLIHPSYREGISTVLLEAASIKLPIITTTVPGCIDVVPDNSHGLLCKPRNVDSLKRAVERFLSLGKDEKKVMTDKTFEYVKKYFSREVVLKNYEELYDYID